MPATKFGKSENKKKAIETAASSFFFIICSRCRIHSGWMERCSKIRTNRRIISDRCKEHKQNHMMVKITNTLRKDTWRCEKKTTTKILINDNNFIITIYKCTFSAYLVSLNTNVCDCLCRPIWVRSQTSFKWQYGLPAKVNTWNRVRLLFIPFWWLFCRVFSFYWLFFLQWTCRRNGLISLELVVHIEID